MCFWAVTVVVKLIYFIVFQNSWEGYENHSKGTALLGIFFGSIVVQYGELLVNLGYNHSLGKTNPDGTVKPREPFPRNFSISTPGYHFYGYNKKNGGGHRVFMDLFVFDVLVMLCKCVWFLVVIGDYYAVDCNLDLEENDFCYRTTLYYVAYSILLFHICAISALLFQIILNSCLHIDTYKKKDAEIKEVAWADELASTQWHHQPDSDSDDDSATAE